MPRAGATVGLTLFATLFFLFEYDIKTACIVLVAFVLAFSVTVLVPAARNQRVLPVACAAGAVACVLFISTSFFGYNKNIAYADKTVNLVAQLTTDFEYRYGRYYYEATVLEADGVKENFDIRLSFPAPLECEVYDLVHGDFTVYRLGASDKSSADYYKANGIYLGAYESGKTNVFSVEEKEKPLGYKILLLRREIKSAVCALMPDETGGFAAALLLGDKSGIKDNVLEGFSDTGMLHIICVSGMHLSVWAMFLLEFAEKLRLNKRIAAVISAFFVVGFMALTGFTYSIMRAGIMMLVFLVAKVFGRSADSLNSLGIAACVILFINPFAAGAVSMQLTFLSCLGLIAYRKLFHRCINDALEKVKTAVLDRVLYYLCETAAVTLCVSVMTLPVLLKMSSGMSLTAVLCNIFVLFAVNFGMITVGIATLFNGIPFLSWADLPFAFAGRISLRYILSVVDFFSFSGDAFFRLDEGLSLLWIAFAAFLIAAAALLFRHGKNAFKLCAALCAAGFAVTAVCSAFINYSTVTVTVIDVGNGSAVLVSKGNDGVLLGCGGASFGADKAILEETENKNITNLSLVLIPRNTETEAAQSLKVLANSEFSAVAHNGLPDGAKLLLRDKQSYSAENMSYCTDFGVTVHSVSNDSACVAFVDTGNAGILISFYPSSDLSLVNPEWLDADAVICRAALPDMLAATAKNVIVSGADFKGETYAELLRQRGINAAATSGNGNITLKISDSGKLSFER